MRLADTLTCVVSQKLVPSLEAKLILAKEVMVMTPSVRAAIKNNNSGEIYQMMAESGDQGMCTLEQDLKRLYLQKKLSLENCMVNANNKRRFQQIMNLTPTGD
jgi:twitching motility protein PilT